MPRVQIQRACTAFFNGDETINPLMGDSVIGLFLLQSLSNLLRAHAMLQPHWNTLTEPNNRLAQLARLRSLGVTYSPLPHPLFSATQSHCGALPD
jgi:hypothetical protein